MRENRYDNPAFFDQYSRMDRSVKGLQGAGEWHELQKLLPDFEGKRVLDLGCGFGWHCMYAAQNGAAKVTGVDLSEKMLKEARAKTHHEQVEYLRLAMEDVDFPPASYDVVISSLALHYVADYPALVARVARMLASGGDFVFSVEHPIFTASGPQDWHYGGGGERLHWPVDHYFTEGKRHAVFLGEHITKYHRTLTTLLNSLPANGLTIRSIVEPAPAQEMLEIPGMQDELRRPMMLLVVAHKL